MLVDERGMPVGSGDPLSDTNTFSNLDPNTSDADAMGGGSQRVIWGTNVSLTDSIHGMKDFLLNFRQKYRMVLDGELEEGSNLAADHPGNERVYVEMMKSMLDLGITALNLDARNLKAYPPTRKLWYQLMSFPDEIITAMDVAIKDVMLELAEKRTAELRQQHQQQQHQARQNGSRARDSSSIPPVPSSDIDRPTPNATAEAAAAVPDLEQELINVQYRVRPFGLDQIINLRDLNPGDMDKLVSIKGLVIRTTPIIPDMKDGKLRIFAYA
jgi:DNA replication licensing factor MCM4